MTVQVGIYNVGGSVPLVTNVPYKSVTWEHSLDDFGVAAVVIENCSDRLLNVHPFTHELRITDDGELVFAGPVRYAPLPLQDGGQLEIVAYDLAYWLALRFVRVAFDYTGTGTAVSTIVSNIVTNALSVLDPNMLPYLEVRACATVHERKSRSVYDTAWELHLQTIVGKLMHMTVLGRSLKFWCVDECLQTLPRASANAFKSFSQLVRDGDTFATSGAVYGDKTLGIIGQSGGVHATWPILVERALDEPSYLNVASANAAAAALVTDQAAFTSANESRFSATMDCEEPWRFSRLAPGMCAPISTRFGNMTLRVNKVLGSVESGIVTRTIEFGKV